MVQPGFMSTMAKLLSVSFDEKKIFVCRFGGTLRRVGDIRWEEEAGRALLRHIATEVGDCGEGIVEEVWRWLLL